MADPHLPFVGQNHTDIRDKILDSFSTPGPCFFLLEGHTGVGKSRIVQEVYESLRKSSPGASDFWPSLVERTPHGDMIDRKSIGPIPSTATWPAGIHPPYAWWALTCSSRHGETSHFISTFEDQFVAYEEPLRAAYRSQMGGEVVGLFSEIAKDVVGDILELGKEELVDRAWDLVTDSRTLVGFVIRRGRRGWSRIQEFRRSTRDYDSGEAVTQGQAQAADRVADLIRGLASTAVPAVLVIEDLHLMGSAEQAFLTALVCSAKHPITLVATAQPPDEENSPYALWRQRNVGDRFDLDLVRAPSEDERIAMLETVTDGRFSNSQLRPLAGLLPTPLMITTYSALESAKDALNRGDLSAMLHVATNNNSLAQIFRTRWEAETDPSLRRVLALAAQSSDDVATEPLSNAPFLPDLISQAAAQQHVASEREAKSVLEESTKRHLCVEDRHLQWFSEPHYARAARQDWTEYFSIPAESFRAGLRELEATRLDNETTPAGAAQLESAERLVRGGKDLDSSQAILTARVIVGTQRLAEGRVEEATSILAPLAAASDRMDDLRAAGLVALARSLVVAPQEHLRGLTMSALITFIEAPIRPEPALFEDVWGAYALLDLQKAFDVAALPRTHAAASPEYHALQRNVSDLIEHFAAYSTDPNQLRTSMLVEFALFLWDANARPTAVDLLLVHRSYLLDLGRTTDDADVIRTTAHLLTLAGGSGSSQVLLPIAAAHEIACIHLLGAHDPLTVSARIAHTRWLMKSTSANKKLALDRAHNLARESVDLFGLSSRESLEAHALLFRLRNSSPGETTKLELQEGMDELHAQVVAETAPGHPARRYVEWMKGNIIGPTWTTDASEERTTSSVAFAQADAAHGDVVQAASMYREFLAQFPPSPKKTALRSAALKDHMDKHGLSEAELA